jgi:hypothetical protein
MKLASQADEARPQLAMAHKLVNSPGFIAGSGQKWRDTVASIGESLGLGGNATINQVFDKIRAGGILDQIKGMAGTGPVRVAEMKFIDTMMAGRENQPGALRAVMTIQDRLYERSQEIRKLIQQNHGIINDSVEAQIEQFKNEHPLFSKEERGDHRLLELPHFEGFKAAYESGMPQVVVGDKVYDFTRTPKAK